MIKSIRGLLLTSVLILGLSAAESANAQMSTDIKTAGNKTQIVMDMVAPSTQVNFQLYHLVKPGDTLWGISRLYEVTLKELAAKNELDPSSQLMVNQRIAIPVGNQGAKADRKSILRNSDKVNVYVVVDQPQSHLYQVRKGDTLYALAKKNGVSVKYLMTLNQLKPKQPIIAGQMIKL